MNLPDTILEVGHTIFLKHEFSGLNSPSGSNSGSTDLASLLLKSEDETPARDDITSSGHVESCSSKPPIDLLPRIKTEVAAEDYILVDSLQSSVEIANAVHMESLKCEYFSENGDAEFNSEVNLRNSSHDLPPEASIRREKTSDQLHDGNQHSGEKPFSCNQCSASFTQRKNLNRHMTVHTGQKPFTCSHCPASFTQKTSLNSHMRIHTGEKPFSCIQCSAAFTRRRDLNRHITFHTSDEPFSCSHCPASFTHESSLNDHMRKHTSEKPFNCSVCSASFTRRCDLSRHAAVHISEKPFSCRHCTISFTHESSLNDHMREHTGEKPFKCSQCSASFARRYDLYRHTTIHTAEKPFSCSNCSASFGSKIKLMVHTCADTGEKPFICSHCSASFAVKEHLIVHMRQHSDEKSLSCTILKDGHEAVSKQETPSDSQSTLDPESGKFTSQAVKSRDETTCETRRTAVHADEKLFSCSQCSASYANEASLRYHTRSHSEKPFRCSICPASFARKYNFRHHMGTHTGEKPFNCSQCSAAFATKRYLNVHVRMHTGEKPFMCYHCFTRFSSKQNLNVHIMRDHTPVKTFTCSHCSASFGDEGDLSRHTQKHTNEGAVGCRSPEVGQIAFPKHETLFQLPSGLDRESAVLDPQPFKSEGETSLCEKLTPALQAHSPSSPMNVFTQEKTEACEADLYNFVDPSQISIKIENEIDGA